ncbi:hypothetical protein P154DRAFT_155670 [Amniculicola lignicola CBS 123094]|uniref:Uncharacterized protein n=1 Tax=Amniculicola lignicola CBS 123094 TaxID=1392246 RepID=A0A6A5WME3_9PLEO|nr:hypothetical protein P154DRAFT_155670 [Amniculicola lignicola CBS 123094]
MKESAEYWSILEYLCLRKYSVKESRQSGLERFYYLLSAGMLRPPSRYLNRKDQAYSTTGEQLEQIGSFFFGVVLVTAMHHFMGVVRLHTAFVRHLSPIASSGAYLFVMILPQEEKVTCEHHA